MTRLIDRLAAAPGRAAGADRPAARRHCRLFLLGMAVGVVAAMIAKGCAEPAVGARSFRWSPLPLGVLGALVGVAPGRAAGHGKRL